MFQLLGQLRINNGTFTVNNFANVIDIVAQLPTFTRFAYRYIWTEKLNRKILRLNKLIFSVKNSRSPPIFKYHYFCKIIVVLFSCIIIWLNKWNICSRKLRHSNIGRLGDCHDSLLLIVNYGCMSLEMFCLCQIQKLRFPNY